VTSLRPPPAWRPSPRRPLRLVFFDYDVWFSVIFLCCKASAMALDRPNQGDPQHTRLNHSGFQSPATIQPSPPPPNIMPQEEHHGKAHSQDRKYVALSTIAVTVRGYPRYRSTRSVCKNGPTDQGNNGPRLTFWLVSALQDNNAAYKRINISVWEKCGASLC
jgi:hypothetical protein